MDTRKRKLIALAVLLVHKERKQRKKWVKEWLKKRDEISHVNLMQNLLSKPEDYRNYMRMDEDTFLKLLNLVQPYITKQDTRMRQAISPFERLSATLRFLVTGANYEELKFVTAISAQSLRKIIPETCRAIIKTLKQAGCIKMPKTKQEWKKVGKGFQDKWQFPHCLGSIDGKHIAIKPPPGSGSYYYNYKKFNSIVLMACGNSDYEFIFCEVGTNGSISDGGAIRNTAFYEKLLNDQLEIPDEDCIEGSTCKLPYVFIGDEAFALSTDFLKPFNMKSLNHERKIYNYRLSRARRVIDNIFGIIVQRFKILQTTIGLDPDFVDIIVMAICFLHNFLHQHTTGYMSPEDEDADLNEELTPLQTSTHSDNPTKSAEDVREAFVNYFNGDGAVDWQNERV